jgi:hypothetical protein
MDSQTKKSKKASSMRTSVDLIASNQMLTSTIIVSSLDNLLSVTINAYESNCLLCKNDKATSISSNDRKNIEYTTSKCYTMKMQVEYQGERNFHGFWNHSDLWRLLRTYIRRSYAGLTADKWVLRDSGEWLPTNSPTLCLGMSVCEQHWTRILQEHLRGAMVDWHVAEAISDVVSAIAGYNCETTDCTAEFLASMMSWI